MRLLKMIIAPRKTTRDLLAEKLLKWPLAIVLGLGLAGSLGFLFSHLQHAYPPPKEMIEAWGKFAMLPFFNIPAESYRLFLAQIMIPFLLGIWILMAGSARLLSILDMIYSGLMFGMIMSALRNEYGPVVRQLFVLYPMFFWPAALGLAGIYNGIVCQEGEGWMWWKSGLVAAVTFFWPMVLISFTLR